MIHSHMAVDQGDLRHVRAGRRADGALVLELEGSGFSFTIDLNTGHERELRDQMAQHPLSPDSFVRLDGEADGYPPGGGPRA